MARNVSRRDFIYMSASALAAAGSINTLMGSAQKAMAATADATGYKAIVCVFLYGGNSSYNWVVPTSPGKYAEYTKARTNLSLAQNSLLPLNGAASDGNSYGLHPNCPELQGLFNSGKAAVIANVGSLVHPLTQAQAQAGQGTPPSLFSHIDQQTQWMTSYVQSKERYGWAGRVADLYASQGVRANLAFNVNVGGANYWQEGKITLPYVLGTGGAPTYFVTNNPSYRNGARQQAALAILNQAKADPNLMVQAFAEVQQNASDKVGIVNNSFNAAGDLTTPFPSVPGDGGLPAQLHEVARCIKAHSQIGDARQFFFVALNGFDTHNTELSVHGALMKVLSSNLNTFYNAMTEIGMQNQVTTFTASEFARTLNSNGDGADHAWGGHSMVLGGAVQGGKYYGTMPSLVVGGADDVGGGRIIPSTSIDQMNATMARWFGVADADLNTIFPNLANFSVRNLGFLG